MKKKIYYAGGWFTPEQEEQHTRIYNLIKDEFDVFNPKLESLIKPGCSSDFMSQTLKGNIEGIKNADLVVVLYDFRDVGTIWEAGCAYANKKPILYYAEKLNGKPFNLMLAKTGHFAENEEILLSTLHNEETWQFKDVYDSFKGEVE